MDFIQPHIKKLTQQLKTNKNFVGIIAIIFICIVAVIFISWKYLLPKMNIIKNSVESTIAVEGMAPPSDSTDVYFFHVTWCPHCKTAKPEWDKLVNNNKDNESLVFHDIDCEKSPDLAKKYSVESYPTILKDTNGNIDEYKKKPTEDALQLFINN